MRQRSIVLCFLLLLNLQTGCGVDVKAATLTDLYSSASAFNRLLKLSQLSDTERCIQAYCSNPALQTSPSQYRDCAEVTCSAPASLTADKSTPYSVHNYASETSPYKLLSLPLLLRPTSQSTHLSRSSDHAQATPSHSHSSRLIADTPITVCPVMSLTDNQILKYCTGAACYAVSPPSHVLSVGGVKQRLFRRAEHNVRGVIDKAELPTASACVKERCKVHEQWLNNQQQQQQLTTACIRDVCCYMDEAVRLNDNDDYNNYDDIDGVDVDDDDDVETDGNTGAERRGNDDVITGRGRRHDAMTRERRVNDDVSQCIQSYCSGKMFPERLRCIVKNCHRSGSSS